MTSLLRRAAERHTSSPCLNVLARDADGMITEPRSARARSWCAIGAVCAEAPGARANAEVESALERIGDACGVFGFTNVSWANDYALDLMPDIWSEAIEADEAQPLAGQALIDARAYETGRLEMIARGEQ